MLGNKMTVEGNRRKGSGENDMDRLKVHVHMSCLD